MKNEAVTAGAVTAGVFISFFSFSLGSLAGCRDKSAQQEPGNQGGTTPKTTPKTSRGKVTTQMDAAAKAASVDAGSMKGFAIRTGEAPRLPDPRAPLLGKGPKDPAMYRCRRDADCVLTFVQDGHCCPVYVKQALRADFLSRLRIHLQKHCVEKNCPIVDSNPGQMDESAARCLKGRCAKVKKKR